MVASMRNSLGTRRALPGIAAALGFLFAAGAIVAGLQSGPEPASAIAPCGDPAVSAEENDFLVRLNQWRSQNISSHKPLRHDTSLHRSAQGYANFLANNESMGGHHADGSSWDARAVLCGYPADYAPGSGEGVSFLTSSTPVSMSAEAALDNMIDHGGSGVYIPGSTPGFWYRCVGVGKASLSQGSVHRVAWVVVIAAGDPDAPCDADGGAVSAQASSSPSPTATTPTATATTPATATPTRTATPTNTTQPRYGGATLELTPGGWSFVSLPAGPLTEVLARAHGCYEAVYQLQGESWLRYSLLVPAYARNLFATDGSPVWIKASGANCGRIEL
jgi:hypothetical protein